MPTSIAPLTHAEPARDSEWHVDQFDIPAYLRRVNHPDASPGLATLRSLSRAHVLAIPFENVDVVLGGHPGLAAEAITDKLVRRDRGGYCYEHALLFAAAAHRLGFPVTRLISRVQPHKAGPRTHMTLLVRADGVDHLVDVGFGAGMIEPMPLRDGARANQAGFWHRLTERDGVWTLAKRVGPEWVPQHAFDLSEQRPIDYEVAHHYVSTHPHSPFTGQLVVLRLAEGISRRLVGDRLTVEHADGRVERTQIQPEQLEQTLLGLDVVLTGAELDALRATRWNRP